MAWGCDQAVSNHKQHCLSTQNHLERNWIWQRLGARIWPRRPWRDDEQPQGRFSMASKTCTTANWAPGFTLCVQAVVLPSDWNMAILDGWFEHFCLCAAVGPALYLSDGQECGHRWYWLKFPDSHHGLMLSSLELPSFPKTHTFFSLSERK